MIRTHLSKYKCDMSTGNNETYCIETINFQKKLSRKKRPRQNKI